VSQRDELEYESDDGRRELRNGRAARWRPPARRCTGESCGISSTGESAGETFFTAWRERFFNNHFQKMGRMAAWTLAVGPAWPKRLSLCCFFKRPHLEQGTISVGLNNETYLWPNSRLVMPCISFFFLTFLSKNVTLLTFGIQIIPLLPLHVIIIIKPASYQPTQLQSVM
jgi:hypothetical protein